MLLLHGYPQTHLMWHAVVEHLTGDHTVVVVDLPGYGESFRPDTVADHSTYSKRAIGDDLVELMARSGFPHVRGGRARPRRPHRLPDGAGPPGRDLRRRRLRRGADRGSLVSRRRADGADLLALGVPRTAGTPPRGPHQRQSVRVLRPPRPCTRTGAHRTPIPRRAHDPVPGPPRRPDRRTRRSARTTAPALASTANRTTKTRPADDRSAARCSCSGARRVRCRSSTATCQRSGDRGRKSSTRRGLDAGHFLVEDQPEQVAQELLHLLRTALQPLAASRSLTWARLPPSSTERHSMNSSIPNRRSEASTGGSYRHTVRPQSHRRRSQRRDRPDGQARNRHGRRIGHRHRDHEDARATRAQR